MPDTDVLVAGAGPTGLALALWLIKSGVRVRIVDRADQPGTTSRALVVHARTLELYDELGIADDIIAAGVEFTAVNMWVRGKHKARAALGNVGEGISPFPYMIILPQDAHERLLIDALAREGVQVERSIELAELREDDGVVVADLKGASGETIRVSAKYLAGCDGARSAVRHLLGIGFPGGTYEHMFYVADVTATGAFAAEKELHVALDVADFLAVFPLLADNHWRLIGTVREDAVAAGRPLTWNDVSRTVLERFKIDVTDVHWFSTYHVHHRVADHFRAGRCFLLGDAGHIHSPVGGQGMNTGIGDAFNLAWKLAEVIHGRAAERLLDSYEPERIAFARRLVATTDRAFVFTTRDGPIARVVRMRLMPALLPILMRLASVRRLMFRTVSQTSIEYRHSPLSRGHVGRVRAGDRLPWIRTGDDRSGNFAPLRERVWQAHVYGTAADPIQRVCNAAGVKVCVLPWTRECARKGLRRDAVYLVRPDGYIAFAADPGSAEPLRAYLDAWNLRPNSGVSA